MMVPQTLAILRATFPIEKLATAIGLWTMSSTIGIASGPIVGGLLISHASWRWIFIVNVPVAAVSMLVSGQHHRRGKEGWLREAQQVPAAAAGALARLGLHADAVRVLEAGRAVLLAERLLQPPGAPADGA